MSEDVTEFCKKATAREKYTRVALLGHEKLKENKNRLDREAGDIMNYLSAIVIKSDGYGKLIRD